jgi:hypothetical protein
MRIEPKSWLIATACAAILMITGAQTWKTLQGHPAVPSPVPPVAAEQIKPVAAAEVTPLPKQAIRRAKPIEYADRAPDGNERTATAPTGVDSIQTKDRLITVTARCDAAEEAYQKIKDDSAQLGQTPHPSITQAWSKMRLALDSARRELDRGEIGEARASLDLAEASAGKVIRAAGGN